MVPMELLTLNILAWKKTNTPNIIPKKLILLDALTKMVIQPIDIKTQKLLSRKNGMTLDNRSIVSYDPYLLMKYQAHVNVEYCDKLNLIKYVNKGPDKTSMNISNDSNNSEK